MKRTAIRKSLRPMKDPLSTQWQKPREMRMEFSSVVAVATREALCDFVKRVLCDYDRLDLGQTPFFVAPITRTGRGCGLMFHVEGPRLLKTSAIWVGDEHRILFYDSQGLRFHEAKLSESPDPRVVVPMFQNRGRKAA